MDNAAITRSFFASAPRIPPDAIFALTAEYFREESPNKVNLGQGAYRDESGAPWVLPSVREARDKLGEDGLNHEYLPILGLAGFREATAQLVLGSPHYPVKKPRLATCQSISGTGSLHLAGQLIARCRSPKPTILIPDPTWSNHVQVFSSLGFDCRSFRYYDADEKTLDMGSYIEALQGAEAGSVVVMHACAHNPTGCDPTEHQWRQIGQLVKEKQLFPVFDAAYLGFNSGSFDEDAFAIRHFVNDLDLEAMVCVSFAKNMGLYGERVGCLLVHASNSEVARNCTSTLEQLQRAEVSNPPAYGAKIAHLIMTSDQLKAAWFSDLSTMSSRIRDMRQALYSSMIDQATPGLWKHIVRQSGMFGFLGLSPRVVRELKEKHHVYMADNSRISIAGLNESNVAYVASAIADCVRKELLQG